MSDGSLQAALELTTAMTTAADAGAWEAVAELAVQRHACLETALAGDAWRLRPHVVQSLQQVLATDQALAARAAAARLETAAALRELRGGARMQGAYAVHAAGG